MPSDVLGVNFFNLKTSEFEFRPGPIFNQVLLADEINRATPRTQSALLEAMQEAQSTIDGVSMTLPQPFIVMATQNPVEMEGTFPLPEAQLDRFMVRVMLGYPTPQEESAIFIRFERDSVLPALEAVTTAEEIGRMQDTTPTVKVDNPVRDYIVSLLGMTRDHSGISLGASPRAGLALYKTAQAWAAIDGRDFVIPDDVKTLAPSILPHRMILSATARLRGNTAVQLIEEILTTAPVPIER
jgi:MoxR-like ATPase